MPASPPPTVARLGNHVNPVSDVGGGDCSRLTAISRKHRPFRNGRAAAKMAYRAIKREATVGIFI